MVEMEDEDEVVPLFKAILDDLRKERDDEGCSIVWRYFLWQTRAVRWLLERRFKRREWLEVFRSVVGQRELNLHIAGICPCSCLLGFVVWLCESGYLNCQITCSIQCPTPVAATEHVFAVLMRQGWKIRRRAPAAHFAEMAAREKGLDLVLIGHPMVDDASWMEAVWYLRVGGGVLLMDMPCGSSFAQLETAQGLEYAEPVVLDCLPSGFEASSEAERDAIRLIADEDRDKPGQLPMLEEARVGSLFVNRRIGRRLSHSLEGSPTDSWEKSEVRTPRRLSNRSHDLAPVVEWQGRWRTHGDVGAVSPEFVFAALDVAPCGAPSNETEERRLYYAALRDEPVPSRMKLQGMGRPLLFHHFRNANDGETMN